MLILAAGAAVSCSASPLETPPAFSHVLIVIEENHSFDQVIHSPYIASLAKQGLLLTDSVGVTHPSLPNYLALFSGSTQGVFNDGHYDFDKPNLFTSLTARGLTFRGYAEGLPYVGFQGDSYQAYVRKHAPWVSFTNVPDYVGLPFTDLPSDYAKLPTVAMVIPNLNNDMHNGSVEQGDTWLRNNLNHYIQWAKTHDSLFVLTFDEAEGTTPVPFNPIATIMVGAHVKPGSTYHGKFDHYNLLRTLDAIYHLRYLGTDAERKPLTGVWEK